MNAKPKKKSSALVPLGVFLMLLGIVSPGLLLAVIPTMQPGILHSLALVSTDLVILGLFLGIGFIIVGNRRNKKWEKERAEQEQALSMKPSRYIVGAIRFLFVWFLVALVVGLVVAMLFPLPGGPRGRIVTVGIGLGWRELPGTVLGVIAGVQSFRTFVRGSKKKDGK